MPIAARSHVVLASIAAAELAPCGKQSSQSRSSSRPSSSGGLLRAALNAGPLV
jgi:hypothetical protein